MRTWTSEFGNEYEVPSNELRAEGFRDTSWHNDECPSFERQLGGTVYRVWIAHPQKEKRELIESRFLLIKFPAPDCFEDSTEVLTTDSLPELLKVIRSTVREANAQAEFDKNVRDYQMMQLRGRGCGF